MSVHPHIHKGNVYAAHTMNYQQSFLGLGGLGTLQVGVRGPPCLKY